MDLEAHERRRMEALEAATDKAGKRLVACKKEKKRDRPSSDPREDLEGFDWEYVRLLPAEVRLASRSARYSCTFPSS